jgi:hypothetical protein
MERISPHAGLLTGYSGMEDLQPEYLITNTAVSALHGRLDAYRDEPFDEGVGVELRAKLEAAWRHAREQEQRHLEWIRGGRVSPEVPSSVFPVHDREEGDYSIEIWRLLFQDGDRSTVLLGVVAADTWRQDRRDGKVLKTVLSYNSAKAAILSRRWVNRDGSPIALPPPAAPAPCPTPSKPPRTVPVPTAAPPPAAAPVPTAAPPPAAAPVPVATLVPVATPAPVAAAPIKLGTDGRPPKGYRRGGAAKDRDAFVLALLRENPKMPTMGADGIHPLVKARFGIGTRGSHVNQLRIQVLLEKLEKSGVRSAPTEANDVLDALNEFIESDERRGRALDQLVRLGRRTVA